MARKLLDYLPLQLQEIREYRGILDALQDQFEKLDRQIDYVLKESVIMTAEDYGLGRWETMLKITPKKSDTVEERRFRILSKLMAKLPYTYRQLENLLDELCGPGNYMIDLDPDAYVLEVSLWAESSSNYLAMCALLERIVPANLFLNTGIYGIMTGDSYVGGAAAFGDETTLLPNIKDQTFEIPGPAYAAGGLALGQEILIYPDIKDGSIQQITGIPTGGTLVLGQEMNIMPEMVERVALHGSYNTGGAQQVTAELVIG